MSIIQKKIPFFTKEEIEYLSKIRIIKKNLVHVHGFPKSMAKIDILQSNEYFGQYGEILKLVLSSKINPDTNKKAYSAYITYSNEKEAAYAILCVDSLLVEGKIIRAFFGTTKYCKSFLHNNKCLNPNKCLFLHELIYDKDIILDNKTIFSYNEHLNLSKKIIQYFNPHTKDIIRNKIKPKVIKFPFIDFIFLKEEEKEKYFKSGNISYVRGNSKELNFKSYNVKINQFINNCKDRNILYEKNVNDNLKFNTFGFSDSNININNNSNFSDKINPNSLKSADLQKLIENSIKHIMEVKPFYSKLNNYPLKKLELDYFKEELEKSGSNLFAIFGECLDCLKDVVAHK